ncbi:MAG: hypothetical protein JO023_05705 [Chloroflexi bacterium]|nr:hypothetical protein [Chloroflexota bacterium]
MAEVQADWEQRDAEVGTGHGAADVVSPGRWGATLAWYDGRHAICVVSG